MALVINKKWDGGVIGCPGAEKSSGFVLLDTPEQNLTSAEPGEGVEAWQPPGATWRTTPESGHFGAFLSKTLQNQGFCLQKVLFSAKIEIGRAHV